MALGLRLLPRWLLRKGWRGSDSWLLFFLFQFDFEELVFYLATNVITHHAELGEKFGDLPGDLGQPFRAEDNQCQYQDEENVWHLQ